MTATAINPNPDPRGSSSRTIPHMSWQAIGWGLPATLVLLSLQSRWQFVPGVTTTLQVTAILTALWMMALLLVQRKEHVAFNVSFRPLAPHYVQAALQASIFIYWGWHWRPVYEHADLIVAQLVFAYSLDMLLSLSRRRSWTLGFGPFPIIFSTNLFLLFRPEWFHLQFVMVAVGILGKEFIRWNRDGKNVHIFNPSAFSLFVFSVILIATETTTWSFAEEIATTLDRPTHIYLHIFLLGLVVQYLFSVTLVTLMSALALIVLNLSYTAATGVYFFEDSNIPIAVFLGLHLLITDPATSPRSAFGKAVFGLLYGTGVFLMYGFLGWLGVPTFYDKLLCVPALNLLVPFIDAAAHKFKPMASERPVVYSEISPAANRIHMAIWIAIFGVMLSTSFVGKEHPGKELSFWENACETDLRNGCRVLYKIYRNNCADGDSNGCVRASEVFKANPTTGNRVDEGQLLSRGCYLGNPDACDGFRQYIVSGGKGVLDNACLNDDLASCFIAGYVELFGFGVTRDVNSAIDNWTRACDGKWVRACGELGEAFLLGAHTSPDPETAARYFDSACSMGYQPSCTTLGLMYIRGHGVEQDEPLGKRLLRKACAAKWELACNDLKKL